MSWHETYSWKCRFDARVCNDKQRWNSNKYRCECKELIHKSKCDDGLNCNSSKCKCKCNISCDAGEYLNYVSSKCRKRLIVKLVLEIRH